MPSTATSLAEAIAENGFAIVSDALGNDMLERLRDAVSQAQHAASQGKRKTSGKAGVRNLFDAAPTCREIVRIPSIRQAIQEILGAGAFVTRAILFDKNPQANWSVPWHQDTTIALAARPAAGVPGFGPWSIKAGVHHVQPPASVLKNLLTMRVHLDDCGEDNGPLQVIAGSHRHGVLEGDAFERERRAGPPFTCTLRAGDVLLMRPLILHASAPSRTPDHRRVIHLEWAASLLPPPLEWNRA